MKICQALALLVLSSSSEAFVAPSIRSGALMSAQHHKPIATELFAEEKKTVTTEEKEETDSVFVVPDKPKPATAAAIVVAEDAEETKQAIAERFIDENIYTFNKVVIDTVYNIICFLYPVTGGKRDFARFFVLETVARVPYFAYLSVMHLRETFGERQEFMSERMRTHYAEADNELHHLLIMESLGGNDNIVDRYLAQTMAFFYYWYVIVVYSVSEPAAYHLSELIEDHAYDTYNGFLTEHAEMLKKMPVPDVAKKYYIEDNPYLFDQFCTVKNKDENGVFSNRRPELNTLYDVFVNIRDDEKEHWKTLCNLVQYNDMQGVDNRDVVPTKPAPSVEAA